jgi:DNA-binding CsgD family transcriptional regulator/PAS domain-containing protein
MRAHSGGHRQVDLVKLVAAHSAPFLEQGLVMNVSHKQTSRLIGAIYECAIDPARWESTLGEMVQAFNCHNALLSLTDIRFDRLLLTRSFGMNEQWWQAFQDKYVPEVAAELSSIIATWPLDKPFVMSRDLSPERRQRSSYIEGGFAPEGIVDVLQCFLIGSPRRFAGLALGRSERQGLFSDGEVELAEILLPHVRRAVMISDLLDARAIERTHFATALDALRCAVLLVDAHGRIIHANRSADKMLRQATTIRNQGGYLKAVLPGAGREFKRAIGLAAGEDIGIGKTGVAIRLSEDHALPLLAHVLPLTTSELRARFQAAAVAAVFVRNRDSAADSAELVATTYGLTPTESRVLSCLLAGRSVPEAAAELRVTRTTARTHLKAIFRKTDTRRQQELVLLASQLSPPVSVS